MQAYAVQPLEPWQEERLERAYAADGRRKMQVRASVGRPICMAVYPSTARGRRGRAPCVLSGEWQDLHGRRPDGI